MESIALTKTIAAIGLYTLATLLLIFLFFSRQKLNSWEYIFLSVSLLILASLILFLVNKVRVMTDDIISQDYHRKISQLEESHKEIKVNQGVIRQLIEHGEAKKSIIYETQASDGLLNSQEIKDLNEFKSWLFIFQIITALFAIPFAVSFFVYGITNRHQTTKVYEIPKEIYSRLTKLESNVTILTITNTVLIFVVVISMLS